MIARLFIVLVLLAAAPAWAGRGCESVRPRLEAVQRGLALAEATRQALDTSGADVVLLARAGQDLSRYRLRWSHLGFAYRADDGQWRVLHKLNQCGSDRSALYRQGLGWFFLDNPHAYRTAWVVPSPALQAALRPLLADDARIATLHAPEYSMVAYPWAGHFQQSNQWAIETLALAAEPQVATREQARAWLRLQGYVPDVIHVGALERLGAGVTQANVSFDDHPAMDRLAGRIATVTADSVFTWLERRGLAGPVRELAP